CSITKGLFKGHFVRIPYNFARARPNELVHSAFEDTRTNSHACCSGVLRQSCERIEPTFQCVTNPRQAKRAVLWVATRLILNPVIRSRLQAKGINPHYWIPPNIGIGVRSTPQPNRITLQIPPDPRVVVPVQVVPEPRFAVEVLPRESQVESADAV